MLRSELDNHHSPGAKLVSRHVIPPMYGTVADGTLLKILPQKILE
jgi:hypothetical protein